MKIAALQTVSGASVDANLATARSLLAEAQAAAPNSPSCRSTSLMGQRDRDKLAARTLRRRTGAIVPGAAGARTRCGSSAARCRWWPTATPTFATPASRTRPPVSARYDKIHLFRFDNGREQYDESRVIEGGSAPQSFTLPSRDGHAWRIGLSVCHDLRFPELYRALAADLLLVPSAFTYVTGQAHWELLLRARRGEPRLRLRAGAGGRHDNGRRTWGHSMIVDPWGEVLGVRAQEGAGVVFADLAAARLAQVRAQLPALDHRVL